MRNSGDIFVDRSVIRMAMRSKKANMYQFCPKCKRLMTRSQGCNHITCICGHEFCVICGKTWPVADDNGDPGPLCHPYFGEQDKHVLNIPFEVQIRLAEQESKGPPAYDDETASDTLCRHSCDMLYNLRLRRELDEEERNESRCDVCGRIFRHFLLQCAGCSTLMCLDCRDRLQTGSSPDEEAMAGPSSALSIRG